jgi:hypothetical protein
LETPLYTSLRYLSTHRTSIVEIVETVLARDDQESP